ncbi:MAG: T9SS type A sorting domain-containing protein [candidate division WOR-3 bacterium]
MKHLSAVIALAVSVSWGGLPHVKDGRGGGIEPQINEGSRDPVLVPSGPVTWVKTYITSQRAEIWFLAPNHHAATDMDNDGDIDIVFTALSSDDPWWGQVYIAYNQNFPVFSVSAISPEVRTPYALDVDDRNGDGLKDVLYCSARYHEDTWGDTYGHPFWLMAPSWTQIDLGEYDFPNHCAAWDFDGDGILDAVFGDENSAVYVSLTGGAGLITVMSGYGEGVSIGDFNEDGQMDIVSAGWGPVAVALNQGGGQSWNAYQVHAKAGHGVQVGDVNGDGHLDIVGCHQDVMLLLGNGAGGFTPVTVYSNFADTLPGFGGLSESEVGIADIDGDGDRDIIVSTMRPLVHTIAWFDNLGGNPPTFQMWPVEPGTGQSSYGVEVKDVNRDGCVDIVAGVGPNLYVWLNTDCATDITEGYAERPKEELGFTGRFSSGILSLTSTRPSEGSVSLEVYNALGARVARASFSGREFSLPLSVPKGTYICVLRAEGERFTGKFADEGTFTLKKMERIRPSEMEKGE